MIRTSKSLAALSMLLTGLGALAACGERPTDSGGQHVVRSGSAPRTTVLELPRGTWPSALLFDRRGILWISEASADAIAERRPDGRLLQHRLGEATETSVSDLAEGPDGNIWFQGFEILGWITPEGAASGYETGGAMPIGLPTAMTIGPDGNVWFGAGSAVKRMDLGHNLRTYPLPAGDTGVEIPDMTSGPDDAVWFLQRADGTRESEALGRIDVEGHYMRIPLRHRHSGAESLAAGPDDALWVAEQARYSIARISTSGRIREFRLKAGTVPVDIVRGHDDALWFTTNKALGRITVDGQIRLWPVAGAARLGALAQAPDGTFWIADPEKDRVLHLQVGQS